MEREIQKNHINLILEWSYLVLFALFFAYSFLNTTTFEIEWSEYFYTNLRILLFVVILLRAACGKRYQWQEVIVCALAGIVLLVSWKHNGYEELSNILLLLLGAKDISYKKIIKVYFYVASMLLIVTIGAALTGQITNYIIHQQGRGARIAFGCVYPTDFSAHVFYIILAWCYLRKEKLLYIEIGAIVLSGILVYVFCNARLNTICILLLAGVMLYNKLSYQRAVKKNQGQELNSLISMLMAMSTTICAFFMIAMTMLFTSDSKIMLLFDKLLNNRLRMGKKGIDLYGFSVWGQNIYMIGNGSRTTEPLNYFFIDSSYLYSVLQYGILTLGILLLLFLIVGMKARQEKNWVLLILIALMSLQCVVEHHMTDIAYNPFLWAAFANISESREADSIFKKLKQKRIEIWKSKEI